MRPVFSNVLEELEHLASQPDLDSCPECAEPLFDRRDEKVCAGCGTRQPIVKLNSPPTLATSHDWSFVAKMSSAVSDYWSRRTAMGFTDPNDTGEQPVPVSPEQIDQVFSLAFGFPAREADKQIVAELGGTTDVLAEYMWDHWMGEPEEPSVGQVQHEIEYVLGHRDTNYRGEQPDLQGGA